MLYGIFIGLIIWGLLCVFSNSDTNQPIPILITQGLVRVTSYAAVIVSICGLIGLLIRGC